MQSFQRYDDQGWFKVGQVEVTTSVLLAALAALSIPLGVGLPGIFRDPLVYEGFSVRSGQVWRLATWPLSNRPDIFVILSIAMMVFVGSDLERELRRRRFAWLIGALVVIPALVTIGFEFVGAAGIGRIVSPLFVVLVLWRPNLRTFFNIPLWALVVVFEVLDLLQILDLRNTGFPIGGLLTFWAASLIVAALGARAFDLTEFHQIPKIPLPQFVTGDPYQKSNAARAKAQRKTAKGKGGTSARRPGKSHQPADVVPIRPEARLDRASQADMDALLDKISATGIDSLTPDERARLDDHSRRLRGN
ncbi:MAG: DUF6576 domain-containing protein [Acidimicrobiales bacterium]